MSPTFVRPFPFVLALGLSLAGACTPNTGPAPGGEGPAVVGTGGRSGGAGDGTATGGAPGSGGVGATGGAVNAGGSGGGGSQASTGGVGGATMGGADMGPAAPPPVGGGGIEIVVKAGDFRREAAIVSFPLGEANKGRVFTARGADGAELPVQVDGAGKATFILPTLEAKAEATFTLTPAASAPDAVTAQKDGDGLKVNLGAATVFRYQMEGKLPGGVGNAFLRGGYLHPIFTPSGVLVTDDYPGDHRHHHGLWSAWAHTTFEGRTIDFWNMGGRTAKVDFDALLASWQGPVHGGFEARQVHVALAGGVPKTALNEIWHVSVYRTHADAPPYFVFDLDSSQEAASATPVKLDKYIYGGFALRGHAAWNGAGNATFLTSEGKTRADGDGTNARWCFIGGRVDGKMAGYAALIHPSNFRAPQPVRINPTNPFFSIAPVRDSGFDIVQGKPYVSRYRIVVTDGAPDKALLDRLWNDYAQPPEVTVKPASP